MFIIRKTQIQKKPNALYYYSREMVPKMTKRKFQMTFHANFYPLYAQFMSIASNLMHETFVSRRAKWKNLCKYHINIARACLTNKCNSIQSPMIIRTSVSLFVHICPEHAKYFRRFFYAGVISWFYWISRAWQIIITVLLSDINRKKLRK